MDSLIYANFSIDWTVLSFGAAPVAPKENTSKASSILDQLKYGSKYGFGAKAEDSAAEDAKETTNGVNQVEASDTSLGYTSEHVESETTSDRGMAEEVIPDEMEGTEQAGIHVTVNQEPVFLSGKSNYIFVDIFNVIDFDVQAGGGRPIVTKINGATCGYSDELHEGDEILVYWKEL